MNRRVSDGLMDVAYVVCLIATAGLLGSLVALTLSHWALTMINEDWRHAAWMAGCATSAVVGRWALFKLLEP